MVFIFHGCRIAFNKRDCSRSIGVCFAISRCCLAIINVGCTELPSLCYVDIMPFMRIIVLGMVCSDVFLCTLFYILYGWCLFTTLKLYREAS